MYIFDNILYIHFLTLSEGCAGGLMSRYLERSVTDLFLQYVRQLQYTLYTVKIFWKNIFQKYKGMTH
jgi:hypothetical protein